MRKVVFILAIIAACFSRPASATPSADLVFCSKLGDKAERIACYDAAAGIAAKGSGRQGRSPQRATARATPINSSSPAAVTALTSMVSAQPIHGQFHGFYGALGGGYGIMEPATAPYFRTPQRANPKGASGIAAVGYNLQHGALVGGLELSGRYGRERDSGGQTELFSIDLFGTPDFVTTSWSTYVDASAHLSARLGLAIDATMVFAQAGFGVAHFVRQSSASFSGGTCRAIDFVNNTVVCTDRYPPEFFSNETSEWVPSALLGAGIEHNFDRFFVRVSGQAEAIKPFADFLWTARATAMVGLRF